MSDIATLLPPNASPQLRAIEAAMAEPLVGADALIAALAHVDHCPVHILPWMAWAFSVEVWESEWPDDVKRAAIRSAIQVHRLKGTVAGIKAALNAIGFAAELTEWFEAEGQAAGMSSHEFGLVLDVLHGAQSLAKIQQALDVLANTKPVRSHLVSVQITAGTPAQLAAKPALAMGSTMQTRFSGPAIQIHERVIALRPAAVLKENVVVLNAA